MKTIGQPTTRQDARLKVTGTATYTAEWSLPNMAHAVLVTSPVARGRIRGFRTEAARAVPGVLEVMTFQNRPALTNPDPAKLGPIGTIPGEFILPLKDENITYSGQAIGVVIADTYERARYAATLVEADIETLKSEVGIKGVPNPEKPQTFFGMEEAQVVRGAPTQTLASAVHKIEATYSTPHEHHNPLEPHAVIADWKGKNLTLYVSGQSTKGPQAMLAMIFEVPTENVRAISHFVGGGFGCKGSGGWPHEILTVAAAKKVGRPVKMALTRQQMFAGVGHRGECEMEMQIGATDAGAIQALSQKTLTQGHAAQPAFFEPCGLTSRMMYDAPNYEMVHEIARNNVSPPIFMRAPGESPGMWALECAIDEMAFELGIDPLDFRIKNHADKHPQSQLPWSSKNLKGCYERGSKLIGWQDRKLQPRGNQDGRYLIGYGMATATYPGFRQPAAARVRIYGDGRAVAASSGCDIGTGAYTAFRQVAADTLGFPLHRVIFELGDSNLPFAPVAGGSQLTASVAPAVVEACEMALNMAAEMAFKDKKSPLFGKKLSEVSFRDGLIIPKSGGKGEAVSAVVKRSGKPYMEACVRTETMSTAKGAEGLNQRQKPPCTIRMPEEEIDRDPEKYAFQSFGAQFCKLRIDEELGAVRILDFVSVMDVGRVLNPKTARSQVIGGIGFGIGMALSEETLYDPNTGRPVIRNIADHHIAAHADVPDIRVEFLNIPDPHINSLGARGIGEIGITGVAAAIGNAVFNATGKRLRDLPLTPDKFV
ncbi:xanthine dehydrogenase family protein molybdopterin-binding subunit [bacterium]|nr:MAG: xanthine dehydrogenase family protein molybdopterin-binding subunit [bacterium]